MHDCQYLRSRLQWLRGEDGVAKPPVAEEAMHEVLTPLLSADGYSVVMGHDPVERPRPGAPPPSAEPAIHAWEDAASTFGKDLSFALEQLMTLGDVPLSRAADFSRIGVFGHSLGGAAALQCAHDDPRSASGVRYRWVAYLECAQRPAVETHSERCPGDAVLAAAWREWAAHCASTRPSSHRDISRGILQRTLNRTARADSERAVS